MSLLAILFHLVHVVVLPFHGDTPQLHPGAGPSVPTHGPIQPCPDRGCI
jgi:hypothetical protein